MRRKIVVKPIEQKQVQVYPRGWFVIVIGAGGLVMVVGMWILAKMGYPQ